MAAIGILIYIAIYLSLVFLYRRRDGYYSAITIYGIAGFVYYLSIPVESIISGQSLIIGQYVKAELTSNKLNLIVIMSILSLLGFSTGYYISRFSLKERNVNYGVSKKHITGKKVFFPIGLAISIFFLLIVLIFFQNELLSVKNYQGNYSTTYTHPIFSYIMSMLAKLIAIACAFWVLSSNKIPPVSIILFAILIGWGFYSSNKDPMLLAFLAVAPFIFVHYQKNIRVLLILVTATIVVFLGLPLFSLYRAGLRGMDLIHYYYFAPSRVDPAGPFLSILLTLSTDQIRLGATYINDLLVLIPKWIWHNRPLDTANFFAQKIITNWQPGQGLGYSPLAEAYTNFGIIGAYIQYFFVGIFWGLFWKKIKSLFAPYNQVYFYAVYNTFGFYLLIIMHRGPVISTIKSLVHFFVIILPPYYLIDRKIYWRSGKLYRKNTATIKNAEDHSKGWV